MAAISISTADILKSVLRHCGEVDDGSSYYSQNGQALDYINKAHVAILGGGNEFDFELSKPWSWAVTKDPQVLVLQPKYENGSVTANLGQTGVAFSVAPSISLQGYLLKISDRPDFMRIKYHVAGSTFATLDGAYADASGTFGFMAILIDYPLSLPPNGILRLTQALTVYRTQDQNGDEEGKIYFIDESQMARDYPVRRIMTGTPNNYSILFKDKDGNYFIRFDKTVADPTRVEWKCIPIPDPLVDSTTNFPIIPVEHRDCLDYAASFMLLTDKNDDRAPQFLQLTQTKLKAMQKAEEKQKTHTSKMRGKLIPRGDLYQRGKRLIRQETS